MLGYKKTERLCLIEFGILLLLHIFYGLAVYPGLVVAHIAIYALLFWGSSLLLFLFLKRERFVICYTFAAAILCTYLISVDTENLIHPLVVFACASIMAAMFVDKGFLIAYEITTLFVIILFPIVHPELVPPHLMLVRYYMYVIVYLFILQSLLWLVKYYQNYREDLDEITREAVAASRSKSTFLANMSHEIRTPMNAITGMSELLMQGNLSSTQREYVSTIRNASDNLLEIINDLLDFSKIDAGKLELSEGPYNIGSVIYDMQNLIATRLIGKEVVFLIQMDPSIPALMNGDDGRIRQMLLNILTNAVKFTEKGSIELEVSWKKARGQKCRLIFQIKDTGIGIRKEEMGGLFDAFVQADIRRNRNLEGTGLGLAITKKLAEQMQGTIQMESEYGSGTTVTITILQEILRQEPFVEWDQQERRRICLYEPNMQYQKNFQEIVRGLGMEPWIIRSLSNLEEEVEDREDTVFFYDFLKRDERLKRFQEKAKHIRFVAMAGIQDQIGMNGQEGAVILRRPVSVMSVAAVLRDEEPGTKRRETGRVHFSAPTARVLVVDDNFVNLKVVEEMLLLYHIDVTIVSSGYDCIRSLEMKNAYDIIFMDHMMPHLDGVETTKIIRDKEERQGGHQVIVALTANAMKGAEKIFLDQGMDDFLPKPVELAQLEQILCRWIPKEKILEAEQEDKTEAGAEELPAIREGTVGGYIDFARGMEAVGNQEKPYLNILKVAVREGEKKLAQLWEYFDRGDLEHYRIEVHALKSSMAGIGAMGLSEMAREHELAAKEGDATWIELHIRELLECYRKVLEEMERRISERDQAKREDGRNISSKRERLLHARMALLEYEPVEAVEWLEKAMSDGVKDPDLQKALQYTEWLEYDKALEILEEVLKNDNGTI